MFSATLHSDEVKDIASRICQDPSLVDLKVQPTHLPSLCSSLRLSFSCMTGQNSLIL